MDEYRARYVPPSFLRASLLQEQLIRESRLAAPRKRRRIEQQRFIGNQRALQQCITWAATLPTVGILFKGACGVGKTMAAKRALAEAGYTTIVNTDTLHDPLVYEYINTAQGKRDLRNAAFIVDTIEGLPAKPVGQLLGALREGRYRHPIVFICDDPYATKWITSKFAKTKVLTHVQFNKASAFDVEHKIKEIIQPRTEDDLFTLIESANGSLRAAVTTANIYKRNIQLGSGSIWRDERVNIFEGVRRMMTGQIQIDEQPLMSGERASSFAYENVCSLQRIGAIADALTLYARADILARTWNGNELSYCLSAWGTSVIARKYRLRKRVARVTFPKYITLGRKRTAHRLHMNAVLDVVHTCRIRKTVEMKEDDQRRIQLLEHTCTNRWDRRALYHARAEAARPTRVSLRRRIDVIDNGLYIVRLRVEKQLNKRRRTRKRVTAILQGLLGRDDVINPILVEFMMKKT
jgi:hypothetical protein